MHDEWYRAWRHDERDYDRLRATDARFRRREMIKRVAGEIMIVGAVVAFAWSMMPV